MIGFDRSQRFRTFITDLHRMSLREWEERNELCNLASDPDEFRDLYDGPSVRAARQALLE